MIGMSNTDQSRCGVSERDVAPLYGMILQHRDDLNLDATVKDCAEEVRALFPILVSIARLVAKNEEKACFKIAARCEPEH